MTKVLAFGSFDPLHAGHIYFLHQAKTLGDYLTVIVTPDQAVKENKKYTPHQSEEERLKKVKKVEYVNEAMLGQKTADPYQLLRELKFDVIAVGYDQTPSDEAIRHALDERGKQHVQIVRLQPFHPEKYKSSFIRKTVSPLPE